MEVDAAAQAVRLDAADHEKTYAPLPHVSTGAHISSMEQYKEMYARSIADPAGFWAEMARTNLSWFRDFKET